MSLIDYRKPSLLVVTSTFPRWKGDSEPPFVYELSSRLTSDFNVTVLAPRGMGSATEEIWENGLRIIRYPYFFPGMEHLAYQGGVLAKLKASRWYYLLVPFFLLGQLLALVRLFRAESFDVIHAHWIFPQGFLTLLAARILRQDACVVITSHGSDLYGLKGRIFNAVKQWVLRRAGKVAVVSQAMRNDVAEVTSGEVVCSVISMGVDLQKLFTPGLPDARHARHILFVGRLVEQKGVDVLLRAVPTVLQNFPDIRVNIVGDGPDRPRLEALATELGVADIVTFVGKKLNSEIVELYRSAGVLVMPSKDREGLGLVAIEAMGCGCPVVASNLPAITDVVVDGVTGLLFAAGDALALAETLQRILTAGGLAEQLAAAAREYVLQRYDWDLVATRYADLLSSQCVSPARQH